MGDSDGGQKEMTKKGSKEYLNLRTEIRAGLRKNFYINKKGEIIQKVTVHLPSDVVDRLKLEALKRKITLSELIRERLKSYH